MLTERINCFHDSKDEIRFGTIFLDSKDGKYELITDTQNLTARWLTGCRIVVMSLMKISNCLHDLVEDVEVGLFSLVSKIVLMTCIVPPFQMETIHRKEIADMLVVGNQIKHTSWAYTVSGNCNWCHVSTDWLTLLILVVDIKNWSI